MITKKIFKIISILALVGNMAFANPEQISPSTQHNIVAHNMPNDLFESLMTQAKNQAQEVGACIQRIQLTINAGKLKLNPTEQEQIQKHLKDIQELIEHMNVKLFVQNSQEALFQGIIITNVIAIYLTKALQDDIRIISCSILQEKLETFVTRNSQALTLEKIIDLAQTKTPTHINNLNKLADNLGLYWYNHTYRALKKYHAYSICKGLTIAAVTAIVAAGIVCQLDYGKNVPYFSKFIGEKPEKLNGELGYWTKDANGNPQSLTHANATKIQGMIMNFNSAMNMQTVLPVGLIMGVMKSMYAQPITQAYYAIRDKLRKLDQNLMGETNPNTHSDGQEKVYFKDLIGCAELEVLAKKLANFIKYPERYERTQLEEHRGILLYGPSQTGKSLFAKALRTLIEEELQGSNKQMKFINAKAIMDMNPSYYTVEYMFNVIAKEAAPCILFFDEIDLIGTHRDKDPKSTSQLLTCMQGVDMASKQIIVIGATNRIEELDQSLLVDGRFGKQILVDYPTYESRKKFLQIELEKRCIMTLTPEYIDALAQETQNCTYNKLKRIITEAIIFANLEKRIATQEDFERTMDCEVRRIETHNTLSAQERKVIATYQAGKAVARHVLATAKEVIKVTINPVCKDIKTTKVTMNIDTQAGHGSSENTKLANNKIELRYKLGEVFTKCSALHTDLLSDQEQKHEIMALLAGNVALQLMLNNSYAQCNKQDRAEALQLIESMLAQGEKVTPEITQQALKLKTEYEQKIMVILQQNKPLLETVRNYLLEHNTIDRYAWKKIIAG